MADSPFKLYSHNVRGMRDSKKREKLYRRFKDKGDIIFIQEAHCTASDESVWSSEWIGKSYFSHGTSASKGVMILIKENLCFECLDITQDDEGRFIILRGVINGLNVILCNIYAPNIEDEHHKFLIKFKNELDKFGQQCDECYILGGDLNFVFDIKLDRYGGNPKLWQKSISTWTEMCEQYDLLDIWRIRHPECKQFTWHRKRPNLIQSRIDHIHVSDNLQVYVTKTEIIPGICSDHSALLMIIKADSDSSSHGPSYWRFNNKLLEDKSFVSIMRNLIPDVQTECLELKSLRCQWDYMKFCIKEKSRTYSIKKAKEKRAYVELLEQKIGILSRSPEKVYEREKVQFELDKIYEEKIENLAIQSRCQFYEKGEKNNKYFLNLIKRNKAKSTIRKLQKNEEVIENKNEILENIKCFYKDLYANKEEVNCDNALLHNLQVRNLVPSISDEDIINCKKEINLEEITDALKGMSANKSPGNDGLTVEFYRAFWPLISEILLNVYKESITCGELTVSQRQSVITLLEKNGKDKLFIENWRPISLINVDTKLFSKCLAYRMKEVLPRIVHENQVAYINGRFIGEGIEVIDGMINYVNECNLPAILLAIDFKKAFDSLHWGFLWTVLDAFHFPVEFINMVKMLYSNIESCVMNAGHSTGYFPIERGVKQGDPISAFLFILAIEILAISVRSDNNIKGIYIEETEIKLSIYADDVTVFLNDLNSANKLVSLLKEFEKVSGLAVNLAKSEAMWLGSNKGRPDTPLEVKWASTVKITGVYFSTNRDVYYEINYRRVLEKMKVMCNMWRQRNLSLIGKVQIIKTFVVSQLNFITNMIAMPNWVISIANQCMFKFLWNDKPDKIKRKAAILPISEGGLSMPDLSTFVETQRIVWWKRYFCSRYHPWKLFMSFQLNKFGGVSILTGNVHNSVVKQFPAFFREMIESLKLYNSVNVNISTLDKCLWYNKDIITRNGKTLDRNDEVSQLGMNSVYDIYDTKSGNVYTWDTLLLRGWKPRMFIQWCSILHCIPSTWKNEVNLTAYKRLNFSDVLINVSAKDIYSKLLATKTEKPSSEAHFERLFSLNNIEWKRIYDLPFLVTTESKIREFQLRVTHNLIYCNERLHSINMSQTKECEFCEGHIETLLHLFIQCPRVKIFWTSVKELYLQENEKRYFGKNECMLFGYFEDVNTTVAANHIILLGKKFIFDCRTKKDVLSVNIFQMIIKDVIETERILYKQRQKYNLFIQKWNYVLNMTKNTNG